MWKISLGFGFAFAGIALLVEWMNVRLITEAWSIELYALSVALLFAGLGIWVGNRLTPGLRPAEFVPNEQAAAYLRISKREWEILTLVAEGHSNKVIARRLGISPNTVKAHVARLFERLDVSSRTQAVKQARTLGLVP